jgi:maleylpyruvate isomerase
MKLYSYWRSSCSWRVRIVLNLKGLQHEIVPVDISPSSLAQLTPDHRARNAMAQVPTLEWSEGAVPRQLSQSVAIAEYLEERHPEPALLPADPYVRARTREVVEMVNSGIQPLQNTGTLAQVSALAGESKTLGWGARFIERGLAALEVAARDCASTYFMGESVTLADVFLVPQLYNARRFGVDVARFPTLGRIEGAASRLDAFERAHPSAQPDCPERQGQ